jgi:hypothetical protein
VSEWEGSIISEKCLGLTYISQLKFFAVVHIGNGDLTLRDIVVVIDVIGQKAIGCETKKQLLSKRPAHAKGSVKGGSGIVGTFGKPSVYGKWMSRFYRVLTMVYNTQNYWVLELCLSSGF